MAEKVALGQEARLHGISEAEYVRRRLGFGAPASSARQGPSLISELEKRGVDVGALLSMEGIREQARQAGVDEASFIRGVLEFTAAPPAKRERAALISELNAVGNNVNQLARSVHRGSDFTRFWREIGQQVTQVLERVLEHD